jgi:decaprenyl-phosphate phosphoribosyltransferase
MPPATPPAIPPATPFSIVIGLLKASRPHQWVKNIFVAAPLVFAQLMYDPHAMMRTVLAVVCFCLLSSSVYLVNDVVDVDKDRAHPLKRFRPIASGRLPLPTAKAAAAVAALGSLAAGTWLNWQFAAVGAGYLLLNLAYSFALKRIPFVDVGRPQAGCWRARCCWRRCSGSASAPTSCAWPGNVAVSSGTCWRPTTRRC